MHKLQKRNSRKQVVDLARGLGWLVMHLPIITTPRRQLYDNLGFPDLVLARAGVVHIWELKAEGGELTDDQIGWMYATRGKLFTPSDWDAIAALLSAS